MSISCALTHLLISFYPPQAGRRHRAPLRRGRGLLDMAKKGLAMSKQYGVGAKLAGMSDPRVALAGKILSAVGGRRKVYRRRR